MSRKKGIVFSSEPVLALSLRNNKNSTRATKSGMRLEALMGNKISEKFVAGILGQFLIPSSL
jgi:hypothetical protein